MKRNEVLTLKQVMDEMSIQKVGRVSADTLFHAYVCPDCGVMHIVSNDAIYKCVHCGHTFVAKWNTVEHRLSRDYYRYTCNLVCEKYEGDVETPIQSFGIRISLLDGTYATSLNDMLVKPVNYKKLFKSMPKAMRQATSDLSLKIVLPEFNGKDEFESLVRKHDKRDQFVKKVAHVFATIGWFFYALFEAIGGEPHYARSSKKDEDEKVKKGLLALFLLH